MTRSSVHAPLRVRWLGRVGYADALELQHGLFARSHDNHLLLLEHEPVYTLGARASLDNLLVDAEAVGAQVVRADRGGDITWHGPGQLVGYPILDLSRRTKDLGRYLRNLEEVIIRARRTRRGRG